MLPAGQRVLIASKEAVSREAARALLQMHPPNGDALRRPALRSGITESMFTSVPRWTLAQVDESHVMRTLSVSHLAVHFLLENAFSVNLMSGTPIYTGPLVRPRSFRLGDGNH